MRKDNFFLIVTIILILGIGTLSIFYPKFLGVTSMLILLLILLALLVLYERSANNSKEIAVIAILGTFSAVARVPFAAIPNVQPCTFIILVSGYVFGPFAGFMIGAETALLSNFFLGQGPWTPWQMFAWGIIGIIGWLFRKSMQGKKYEFLYFLIIGFLSGYLYGMIMNVWYWLAFIYPLTWQSFLMVESTSIWFDTLHALGNVIFIDLFAIRFIKLLERYKLRYGLFNKIPKNSAS